MSNFMHKVKDAMTDRDRDTDRGYNEPGQDNYGTGTDTKGSTNHPSRSSNPFGSSRSGEGTGRSGTDPYAQTRAGGATNAGPHDSSMGNKMDPRVDSDMDNRASQGRTGNQNLGGSSGSDPYTQSRTGGASNAGPHDSSMGNKMDPRVDSDMGMLSHISTNIPNLEIKANSSPYQDNRASQGRTEGERPNVAHAQGFNPSNTSYKQGQQQQQPGMQQQSGMQQQQPGMQAFDNHKKSEENYSKNTQEHSSHSQPGEFGSDMSTEDDHSTSMQENKSHSTTSHAAPCQTNTGAESGGMGGTAQPSFGGNAAAGGSSYGGAGAGGQSGAQAQNVDPMNKLDPRTTRAAEQQNLAGNQRGY
ncbi:uncharacterized protein N7503_008259 [Penicillium pulvis]|uniref:uncharacterized protein n=1 Tax=Penicillium pulvis TaxID=1562058 RepID=UPI002549BA1A|nr:uncharacterized protein N7503_008259 [Penicillium pulvis]KAJ5792281.1 hypothetical protein N7503_008259 [Penicillium pulvis]